MMQLWENHTLVSGFQINSVFGCSKFGWLLYLNSGKYFTWSWWRRSRARWRCGRLLCASVAHPRDTEQIWKKIKILVHLFILNIEFELEYQPFKIQIHSQTERLKFIFQIVKILDFEWSTIRKPNFQNGRSRVSCFIYT